MRNWWWIVVCCWLFAGNIMGNSFLSDTVAIDTARLLSDRPLKNPMGAVLRSAILPGWGQWYNEQHAKAGVAFTLNGYFIYKIWDFHRQWRTTRDQGFRDRRNLYTWYFGLAYALTLLDAYVDAYLYGFDQAMRIGWLPQPISTQGVIGWRVSLSF